MINSTFYYTFATNIAQHDCQKSNKIHFITLTEYLKNPLILGFNPSYPVRPNGAVHQWEGGSTQAVVGKAW